jgi:hypothetical protein
MDRERHVESIKVDVTEVTLIYVPRDEGRALSLSRWTQEDAGTSSRTVACLEIRSVQFPLLSHGCVSFAVEVD